MDGLAGIPLSALPPHVRAALDRPQQLHLAISADAASTVLGTSAGLAMQRIQAHSGAHGIRLGPEDFDSVHRRVSVTGTAQQLLEAHRLLQLALLSSAPARCTAVRGRLLLPTELASAVVGHSSETVRQISHQSGATVTVDPQLAAVDGGEHGCAERLVRIVGTIEQARAPHRPEPWRPPSPPSRVVEQARVHGAPAARPARRCP